MLGGEELMMTQEEQTQLVIDTIGKENYERLVKQVKAELLEAGAKMWKNYPCNVLNVTATVLSLIHI